MNKRSKGINKNSNLGRSRTIRVIFPLVEIGQGTGAQCNNGDHHVAYQQTELGVQVAVPEPFHLLITHVKKNPQRLSAWLSWTEQSA